MKRDARLQALIQEMEEGRLSRNKNFDAYNRPDVANAWARRKRLYRLWDMMDKVELQGWRFSLQASEEAGSWTLTCHSEKLNGSWVARLFDFELHLLHRHPRGRALLGTGAEAG